MKEIALIIAALVAICVAGNLVLFWTGVLP